MQTLKLLSNTLITMSGTGNTINLAKVAHIVNANNTVAALITQANSSSNCGVAVCPPNGQISIQKPPTDTLISNLTALVYATTIAFTN